MGSYPRVRKKARKVAGATFLSVFAGLSIEKFAISGMDIVKIFENFQIALVMAFIIYLLVLIADFP